MHTFVSQSSNKDLQSTSNFIFYANEILATSLFLYATISDKAHSNKCAQLKTDVYYGAIKISLRQHSNKNVLIWFSW